jgi:MFS family permease
MSVATESPTNHEEGTELPRRVVLASMAGVVSVMLLAALDGTIVGTAMPRVIAELHGFEHYALVTTVYMLAATVVVPIVGKLSDLFGRKPFLLAGVAIFVFGSALCGLAQSMVQLVSIPPTMLSTFANPQALMDPDVASRMSANPAMVEQMRPVLTAVKMALSLSLHDVFVIGTIVAAAGIVFAQLVIDLPLRKSNARSLSPEGV